MVEGFTAPARMRLRYPKLPPGGRASATVELAVAASLLLGVVFLPGCLEPGETRGAGGETGADYSNAVGEATSGVGAETEPGAPGTGQETPAIPAEKPDNLTMNETGRVVGELKKGWAWKVEPNATHARLEFDLTRNPDLPYHSVHSVALGVVVEVGRPDGVIFRCAVNFVEAGLAVPILAFRANVMSCYGSISIDMESSGHWWLSVHGGDAGFFGAGYCVCGYVIGVDVRY